MQFFIGVIRIIQLLLKPFFWTASAAMKPKRSKKLVAFARRTFVTDCPHCHKHFYGFNDYVEHVKIGHKHYRFVCHRCAQQVQKDLPIKADKKRRMKND